MSEVVRTDDSQVVSGAEQTRTMPVFTPPVDIYETEEALVLLADMPGLSKEDLSIRVEEDTLTLEGEISDPVKKGETFLAAEYRIGRYFRQFTVSEAIDREKISAKLKNGELTLTLPKAVSAKPQRIQVEAS